MSFVESACCNYELKLVLLGDVRQQIRYLNIEDDGSLKDERGSFSYGKIWAKEDPAHTVIPVVYGMDGGPVAWGVLHRTADCGMPSSAVASVYVDPNHRGHGLGVKVASVLWRQARDKNVTCIQVDDSRPDAKALWVKTACQCGYYREQTEKVFKDLAVYYRKPCQHSGTYSCLLR